MNLITREERKVKSARIYTNDLNRIIASTKYFVSDSNSTKCYQYIKLEFCSAENRVVAIAVDGYRMSVEHSVISDCDEDFMVFIKSNIRIPKKQYATISLTEDGEEAIIRCNGFSFGFSQPESNNFDWKKAIPTSDILYRIGFNGNYLLSALQAAKASLGDSFRHPVVLEFRSSLEPIVLRTNEEDIKMVLPVRLGKNTEDTLKN